MEDDARHSLLAKARPLSQTDLSAFLGQAADRESLLPRDTFGRYEVREVDVQSALTLCRMPSEPWSLNPYMGCSHDCLYCYVPDVAHVERKRWGSYVIVKRNLPAVLARELGRKPRREVFLSSATDPYQPAEGTHLVTQRCLAQLRRVDWPLRVLTRNPLVRRDAKLLREFSDLEIGMSVPTLDDELRRLLEPGAPTIEARLRTLRALADEGLAPYANLAPAYPLGARVRPLDVAEAFREAGVRIVYAWPWRYLRQVLPAMAGRLPRETYDAFARTVADAGYYERLFRQLKRAFAEAGVPLVCGSGGPSLSARPPPAAPLTPEARP